MGKSLLLDANWKLDSIDVKPTWYRRHHADFANSHSIHHSIESLNSASLYSRFCTVFLGICISFYSHHSLFFFHPKMRNVVLFSRVTFIHLVKFALRYLIAFYMDWIDDRFSDSIIVYGVRVQLTQAEQTNGFNTIPLIQSIVWMCENAPDHLIFAQIKTKKKNNAESNAKIWKQKEIC